MSPFPDSFARILGHFAASKIQGPQSFTVEAASGLRLEYGTTSDSKAWVKGGVVRAWHVAKAADRRGNFDLDGDGWDDLLVPDLADSADDSTAATIGANGGVRTPWGPTGTWPRTMEACCPRPLARPRTATATACPISSRART